MKISGSIIFGRSNNVSKSIETGNVMTGFGVGCGSIYNVYIGVAAEEPLNGF